jgi:hypothetical protein
MISNEVMAHLEAAVAEVRTMFIKAATRIEALNPDGSEKIPATKLAEDLASEQGQTGPQVYPTLKILLNGYPGVEISRGAHGGIRKKPPVTATQPLANPTPDGDTGASQ